MKSSPLHTFHALMILVFFMSFAVSSYTLKNMQATTESRIYFTKNCLSFRIWILQQLKAKVEEGSKDGSKNKIFTVKKNGFSYQCTYCSFNTNLNRYTKIHTNELHRCDQCE